MAILDFPEISQKGPSQFVFRLTHNTQTFESPLNKAIQTQELPGARWSFSATWDNLTDLDARILKGWIAKLRGQAGRFYMGDLQHPAPSGLAYGSGVLMGLPSDTALTTSWSVSAFITADNTHFTADSSLVDTTMLSALWFQPGDYISVNGELKVVTEQVYGAYGGISIPVEPPFRTPPPVDAPLVFVNPKCVMRLIDDAQDNFQYSEYNRTSITISGIEVF